MWQSWWSSPGILEEYYQQEQYTTAPGSLGLSMDPVGLRAFSSEVPRDKGNGGIQADGHLP